MTNNDDSIFVALARDLSGGDAEIIERVRGYLDAPPTTLEEIGFYGGAQAAPEARIFWGLVTALARAGYLYSVEDKYTPEIIDRWLTDEVFDLQALPTDARALLCAIRDNDMFELEEDEDRLEQLYEQLFRIFGAGTRALEAQLEAQGRALLSVDATDGDTMFFAVVQKSVADSWCSKAFAETAEGYRPGIRPPMWDRFWYHLVYAYHLDDADAYRDDLPPGTRSRKDALPLVTGS
jgi:hypothetical protein